ncbi:putative receptor-like protein kinase At5g39000 [Henckelia pumila]|uniref:putative receptor-like protein kinase At5g39000 n=1 Tax=Henckelia pumila TaxID=405737 RepID=UPI003C6DF79A
MSTSSCFLESKSRNSSNTRHKISFTLVHTRLPGDMDFISISSAAFIFGFFTIITAAIHDHQYLTGDILINCGSTKNFAAVDGRKWIGDTSVRVKGSSTSSSVAGGSTLSADQAQYKTARISRSQFSYTFHLNPGPKFIRLHFNPVLYRGFTWFKDLFTVEAGPFTLLGNFSASLTADALGDNGKSFVREFCINIEENQWLDIVLYPDQSIQPRDGTYAFINGIEIISIPMHLSYFRGGVEVVGLKYSLLSHIYNHNHTAFEIIHRQNVKPSDDFANMFSVRTAIPERRINKLNNITWKIAVDVGFRYFVRIHHCELGLKNAKQAQVIFKILINEIRVEDYAIQLVEKMDENEFLPYRDYVTTIQGRKQDGKQSLLISIESTDELMDRNGPFKGFEILKLSNLDNSLASPNPQPPARDSPYSTIHKLLKVCGGRNIIATASVTIITIVNIVVYILQRLWEDNITKEEKMPSARARRLCRRFSLAEIEAATRNFNHTCVIGKGGFGKVYKGIINNGQDTVAIKRLKYSSNQGAREFWTEIETLSELRHVNLVSLIGYCNEQQEMILVYEYMIHGTLGDHLFKQAMGDKHSSSLSWNQYLNICIGAGRGLDYLHTGQGIIHRDVKTSNILLDKNFIAKVSDFGLAKPENVCGSQSYVSTNVKGTHGYFDPYYIRTREVTRKSDIYAFGVVLLEVLCRRPALDPRLEVDQRSLATWARGNISKGEVEKIISSDIKGEILPDSLRAFVRVAESCLDDEPKNRPTMGQVVLQLEFALDLQEKPNSLVSNGTGTAWDAFSNAAKPSNKKDLKDSAISDIKMGNFDWETIQAATNGFSGSHIIGKARGGTFYKAVLHTRQQVVAVKRVNRSFADYYLWIREIDHLSKYKHPNIMKLLGSLVHGEEMIPVYEFMENTSSLRAILILEGRDQLPWALCFKLITGIARGVHYLHQSPDLRTIFSNIDPRNIFLDHDNNPKISINYCDPKTDTEISTTDYDPPEGRCADNIYASDIYSFGLIILEILSEGKQDTLDRVWKLWGEGMTLKLATNPFNRCIAIALLCTQSLPRHRPDISQVLGALQGGQDLKDELRKARTRRNSR